MSTFKVPLTTITDLNLHPNADSLLLAKVLGYDVIVPIGVFDIGDYVIYVPVGSVLSEELENIIFPEDAKIKLHNRRIRAIKIRGVVSQGLLINPLDTKINEILCKHNADFKHINNETDYYVDRDVSEYLGITKYVEPVSAMPSIMKVSANANPYKVKEFKEYTDVEHGKYYDRVLQDGEMVYITQKLHGTSARYGYFPRPAISLLDKARKFLGLLPEWQFCWGSRRVQIQSKPGQSHSGYTNEKQGVDFGDVYTKIAQQENLRYKIPKGYAVYGEIVGWGIQKGYLYNCGQNQHKFYVYDIMKDGKWLNYGDMLLECAMMGLTAVPELYFGPYSKEKVDSLLTINVISPEVAEGVVVGPELERNSPACGRIKLKYINPEYLLLKNNTEFQ